MTYEEKFKKERPHFTSFEADTHMKCNCPEFADRSEIPGYCAMGDTLSEICAECWRREIPEHEVVEDSTTKDHEPTNPTPILDEATNPLHITFYPANIPNPDEMLANVINTANAIKDRPVYITIM